MFKKKGNNNKKVDLMQETQQIQVQQRSEGQDNRENNLGAMEGSQEQSGGVKPIVKHKAKPNIFSLEGMQKNNAEPSKLQIVFTQEKVANQEIEQCFTQLRKIKEKQIITEEQQRYEDKQNYDNEKPEKMVIRVENVDLQSQPQGLEIEVDEEGGLSPELGYGRTEDYDDLNGDYEDQLIRKTLTKRNYDNLSKNGGVSLSSLKKNQANDSLIQKLKKVNASNVRKAIERDLYNKRLKLKELNDTLKTLTSHGGSKKAQILQKELRLKGLKEQLSTLIQVIEYIYYYGDKVAEFSVPAIKQQLDQQNSHNHSYNQEQF